MKTILYNISLVLLLASCNGASIENESNSATDLSSVTIGEQVWMSKNLNVDTFRNGDPIPHAKTEREWDNARRNGTPAWCYYDNNTSNGEKYGKLYNYYAVMDERGLAPEGWHVPSDKEWKELTNHLGGKNIAGKKMKSTSGWADNGNGTNESGFNALPAGYRTAAGTGFMRMGGESVWWSTTKSIDFSAMIRMVENDKNYLWRTNGIANSGYSVRCIKD